MLHGFLNHRYFIWGLLALPSIPMTLALLNAEAGPQGKPVAEMLLHPTGEFAARFMIVAMIITPMRMLLPRSSFWQWMMKRRRYFGVAAFVYALVHTVLYIVDMGTLAAMLGADGAEGLEDAATLGLSGGGVDAAALDFCPQQPWPGARSLRPAYGARSVSRVQEPRLLERTISMIRILSTLALLSVPLASANATGRMTCAPVDRANWITQDDLTAKLIAAGWAVRFIKEDGGCWEVYGIDEDGRRVEGYFHPQTGEKLLVAQRGRILFQAQGL